MNAERNYKIAVLAGDGIGPEVMVEALKVLDASAVRFGFSLAYRHAAVGGAAIDQYGTPLPEKTWEICQNSDAVLLGSIGGPQWDHLPLEMRPETGGLLALRRKLGLYANLRPVSLLPELKEMSPLALRHMDRPVDLITVRELSSGIYFGEPRLLNADEALDSLRYRRTEIERISRVAFSVARGRRRHVTSVDKANVLATSVLWRRIVNEVAGDFPDVALSHMYVDNAAMQLMLNPLQFDVILTENMFGDILSDESAAICGSLGMLPSASLGERLHLFEPAGGSAPDIAGRGTANPVAQILSTAMMLDLSFSETKASKAISQAVSDTIAQGCRTADIAAGKNKVLTTVQMGDAIIRAMSQA
jgi:3-isopropylmalate dehydrogenase